MTTGEKIKLQRTRLGLSQEELGARVGVQKAAIYKYENGLVVNLKRSMIERLAAALGVPPSYLLDFVGIDETVVINERIKQSRLARGLTLAQVADAIGVKEATAQRYESGDIKNIKHETILRLSELFSVSPAYLMGWTDEPHIGGKKETAPANEDGLSPLDTQLTDLLRFLTDDQKKLLLAQIETLLRSQ